MSKLSILVNSCDKYSDAWDPFFRLLHTFWPSCNYEIVLVTETKNYTCDFLNVRTVLCGKAPWGKRLKMALKSIESEFVLYFLEDFFLMQEVGLEGFNAALKKISKDPSIGYIGLKNNREYRYKDGTLCHAQKGFLVKDELMLSHRVNNMVAIWRREWFIDLIREYENPWEFDNYASIRSKRYPYQVLLINNEVYPPVFTYEIDYQYGYGISGGKWLPANKELFEKNNIEVDFSRLGWLDAETINRRINGTKAPTPQKITLRGRLSLMKKSLRKFRSLHLPF